MKRKKNLTQSIKLVEYCSRLVKSDPKLANFKPISCQCLSKDNYYTDYLAECSHQDMLTDQNLFNYIIDETISNEENEQIIKNKIGAIMNIQLKKIIWDYAI